MFTHSVMKSGSKVIGTRWMCTPSMISYGSCSSTVGQ